MVPGPSDPGRLIVEAVRFPLITANKMAYSSMLELIVARVLTA